MAQVNSNYLPPHALALIERISSNSTYLLEQERSLELAKNATEFQLSLAQGVATEFAPAILKKVDSKVRAEYKSNPANNMAGEQCQNEWQEFGAMLFDGSHLLLEMGIQQLQYVVLRSIGALSYPEQLALWFHHCENPNECLGGRELGDTFDVLTDTDTFDPLIESISESLQNSMRRDWENKLREMESSLLDGIKS